MAKSLPPETLLMEIKNEINFYTDTMDKKFPKLYPIKLHSYNKSKLKYINNYCKNRNIDIIKLIDVDGDLIEIKDILFLTHYKGTFIDKLHMIITKEIYRKFLYG